MTLPHWINPQLTKLVEKTPTGPQWVHEVKFDGYRMAARVDQGNVQLFTRSGLDWTAKYPATAAAVAKLPVKSAYLDGELCGVRPDGVTSFALMQEASDAGLGGLVYCAFDVLELGRGALVAVDPNHSCRRCKSCFEGYVRADLRRLQPRGRGQRRRPTKRP
jgi:ATP-dependent DNA ligase